MAKYCIINIRNKKIIDKIEYYGYNCISTEKSTDVSQPISLHADVLYLKTENKEIYVSECQKNNINFLKSLGYRVNTVKLLPGYKDECKLNTVVTDNMILCNPKTSTDISKFKNNKIIVYTNQGYTRCSTVVIDNDNFITEDVNIYQALSSQGKNCLQIEKGQVRLEGYDYGFIGGASVFLKEENTLLFFGDITIHSDYFRIKSFCESISVKFDYVQGIKLEDLGSAITLNI